MKNEQKHGHLDGSVLTDEAARFENLVACHLLKWVHVQQDTKRREIELRDFRDIDHREVDFVVVEGRKPILFVECKLSDTEIDRSLRYLHERFPDVDAWQISARGAKDHKSPAGIRVSHAVTLLGTLT